MDTGAFDRLSQLIAQARDRRSAISALAAVAVGLLAGEIESSAKPRKKRRGGSDRSKRGGSGKQEVTPGCSAPRAGANLAGCNFSGQYLVDRDLHGITARGADFSQANLCGTDLHGASFAGSNLTLANLRGATVGNVDLSNAVFCQSTMPDGSINDSDCPGGLSEGICCDNDGCATGQFCNRGLCEPVRDTAFGCRREDNTCENPDPVPCPLNDSGFCFSGRDEEGKDRNVCAFDPAGFRCLEENQTCAFCAEIMPAYVCLKLDNPQGCGCASGRACILPALPPAGDCPDIVNCRVGVDDRLVGPIPGAPIGLCFRFPFCVPCDGRSFRDLNDLCNQTYSGCSGNCYVSEA
jgi:hypothetical protein